MLLPKATAPGYGLSFGELDVRVTNRTGGTRVIGDVVMLDIQQSDAAVTDSLFGTETSGFANAILPTDSGYNSMLRYGLCGVVVDLLDDGGADDGVMLVRMQGECDVNIGATASTGVGLNIVLSDDSATAGAATTNVVQVKTLAISTENRAATAASRTRCLVDGIYGFGLGNN